jgi:hypothetical protein
MQPSIWMPVSRTEGARQGHEAIRFALNRIASWDDVNVTVTFAT